MRGWQELFIDSPWQSCVWECQKRQACYIQLYILQYTSSRSQQRPGRTANRDPMRAYRMKRIQWASLRRPMQLLMKQQWCMCCRTHLLTHSHHCIFGKSACN